MQSNYRSPIEQPQYIKGIKNTTQNPEPRLAAQQGQHNFVIH